MEKHMSELTLYGAAYSVYVRIARLVLEEKGVPYRLVEIDIFAEGGPSADYRARHPFCRIPAFEHDGFRLYETGAITRYVDEAFDGPQLQPASVDERARMNQIISLLDNYAYRAMVWDVYVERVSRAAKGKSSDEARIAAGLAQAEACMAALVDLMGDTQWLAGDALSLADLHAAPMFACFTLASEGDAALARHGPLRRWWQSMSARDSMAKTNPP
jgi:glutathione S-transferase